MIRSTMRTKEYVLVGLLVIGMLFTSIRPNAAESISALVEKVQPATVLIETYDAQGKRIGQGSGFFVNGKGEIITNWHVMEGASSSTVRTASGTILAVRGIVAKDEQKDLARIVLVEGGGQYPHLNISTTIPKAGERIIVIGSPFGLETTVSDGLVSGIRNISESFKIIQISAPISSGSSGSPVLNLKGQVVAIATFQFKYGQNLNFAIPSTYILRVVNLKNRTVTPLELLLKPKDEAKQHITDSKKETMKEKEEPEKWLDVMDVREEIVNIKNNSGHTQRFIYYNVVVKALHKIRGHELFASDKEKVFLTCYDEYGRVKEKMVKSTGIDLEVGEECKVSFSAWGRCPMFKAWTVDTTKKD